MVIDWTLTEGLDELKRPCFIQNIYHALLLGRVKVPVQGATVIQKLSYIYQGSR